MFFGMFLAAVISCRNLFRPSALDTATLEAEYTATLLYSSKQTNVPDSKSAGTGGYRTLQNLQLLRKVDPA